jgi:hypothetical protein
MGMLDVFRPEIDMYERFSDHDGYSSSCNMDLL